MEERLQKVLARMGLGSRRACEEMIEEGRVTVNMKRAELGCKVDPVKDRIEVNGEVLEYHEPEKVYYMLNKPRFVLSDHVHDDPRRSVYSLLEDSDDLIVVGRLDFESEGLILMTNDGDLANKLTHPRYGKEKEYEVLVAQRPDDKQLKAWRHGVVLENGEKTGPARVVISRLSGKGAWLRVIMTEGRKRQIREICKTIGIPVVKLVRVRIGNLELGNLPAGTSRPLSEKEVENLRKLVAGKQIKGEGNIGRSSSRTPVADPSKNGTKFPKKNGGGSSRRGDGEGSKGGFGKSRSSKPSSDHKRSVRKKVM